MDKTLWIFDLRTNMHFTLKTNPLKRADLDEFVSGYHPENRHERKASWSESNPQGRWRPYRYEDLLHAIKSAWTSSGSRTTAWKTRPTSKTPTSSPPRSP